MTANSIMDDIKEKCSKSGHSKFIITINNEIKKGATGTEITMIVGKLLKNLLKSNSELSRILEADIRKYLKLCEEMGLVIL